ncbi:MAG: ATP-binding cassette domain-containing protein [Rhodospirillaceae bacterium]|jgi:ATP-binding cassette subfamily F protein 3|nr:ATP-binding cassette domain-containing protein [Rhodospirillaceae bacterium]
MININHLTYRIGDKILFNNAGCHISKNQHVSLVGCNGSCKSTLFKLIRKELYSDAGTITVHCCACLDYADQEAPDTNESLIKYVFPAIKN